MACVENLSLFSGISYFFIKMYVRDTLWLFRCFDFGTENLLGLFGRNIWFLPCNFGTACPAAWPSDCIFRTRSNLIFKTDTCSIRDCAGRIFTWVGPQGLWYPFFVSGNFTKSIFSKSSKSLIKLWADLPRENRPSALTFSSIGLFSFNFKFKWRMISFFILVK